MTWSYGVVLVHPDDCAAANPRVLVMRRRHSYAFAEYVLGRYREEQLPRLVARMSGRERGLLAGGAGFEDLARGFDVFGRSAAARHRAQRAHRASAAQARQLSRAVATTVTEPELSFPKGRMDKADRGCPRSAALRELHEETGLPAGSVELLPLDPVTDLYEDKDAGAGRRRWGTALYVGRMADGHRGERPDRRPAAGCEASKVLWMTLDQYRRDVTQWRGEAASAKLAMVLRRYRDWLSGTGGHCPRYLEPW